MASQDSSEATAVVTSDNSTSTTVELSGNDVDSLKGFASTSNGLASLAFKLVLIYFLTDSTIIFDPGINKCNCNLNVKNFSYNGSFYIEKYYNDNCNQFFCNFPCNYGMFSPLCDFFQLIFSFDLLFACVWFVFFVCVFCILTGCSRWQSSEIIIKNIPVSSKPTIGRVAPVCMTTVISLSVSHLYLSFYDHAVTDFIYPMVGWYILDIIILKFFSCENKYLMMFNYRKILIVPCAIYFTRSFCVINILYLCFVLFEKKGSKHDVYVMKNLVDSYHDLVSQMNGSFTEFNNTLQDVAKIYPELQEVKCISNQVSGFCDMTNNHLNHMSSAINNLSDQINSSQSTDGAMITKELCEITDNTKKTRGEIGGLTRSMAGSILIIDNKQGYPQHEKKLNDQEHKIGYHGAKRVNSNNVCYPWKDTVLNDWSVIAVGGVQTMIMRLDIFSNVCININICVSNAGHQPECFITKLSLLFSFCVCFELCMFDLFVVPCISHFFFCLLSDCLKFSFCFAMVFYNLFSASCFCWILFFQLCFSCFCLTFVLVSWCLIFHYGACHLFFGNLYNCYDSLIYHKPLLSNPSFKNTTPVVVKL